MLKRLSKSAAVGRAASALIGAYIRLVHRTSRWTYVDLDHFQTATAAQGAILAFWHGRMMMFPPTREHTDRPFYMLVSANRDGDIIADAVSGFGVGFIRGSAANPKKPEKDKSGAPAVAQLLAALEEGAVIGLTPDGPRGPGEKAKPGIVRLAQMAGAPIVPVSFSATRGRRFSTWDRFFLAAPFSKGYYVVGAPISAPKEDTAAAIEETRRELESALQAVTRKADELANRA